MANRGNLGNMYENNNQVICLQFILEMLLVQKLYILELKLQVTVGTVDTEQISDV